MLPPNPPPCCLSGPLKPVLCMTVRAIFLPNRQLVSRPCSRVRSGSLLSLEQRLSHLAWRSRPLRTWSTLSCSAFRCFSNSGFIIEPHRTAYALSDSTGIYIVPFAQTSPLSSLSDWPAPSCFFSSFSSDSISLGKPSRPVPNRCLSLCFHCTWHLSLLLLLSQDPGCLFIHSLIGSTHIYRAGSGDRMVS